MKTPALFVLIIAALFVLVRQPTTQHSQVEYKLFQEIGGIVKGTTKAGLGYAGTAAKLKEDVANIKTFMNKVDWGGSVSDDVIKKAAKESNLFGGDTKEIANFVAVAKEAIDEKAFKIYDNKLFDTRTLEDIGDLDTATQVKAIDDAVNDLRTTKNLSIEDTWRKITWMKNPVGRTFSDVPNTEIKKTIDDYVTLRGKPLEKGSELATHRKLLDDPNYVSKYGYTGLVAVFSIGGLLASILTGLLVKPAYMNEDASGDTYNPYTDECPTGDLACKAAQWVDWFKENSVMVGSVSSLSLCMCLCCCCMMSMVLMMDENSQNSFY
jgi:hypothetical protein